MIPCRVDGIRVLLALRLKSDCKYLKIRSEIKTVLTNQTTDIILQSLFDCRESFSHAQNFKKYLFFWIS